MGIDVDIEWDQLGPRLAERAAYRLQLARTREDRDKLWVWERPLKALEAARNKKAEAP
jgi:hypothetical protein